MNDFILEFTLKQHTPILHFQHDQKGATLRGTEVKAKLDRYLWEHVWENDFEKGKSFLVGYPGELKSRFITENYRALDYKIHFVAPHDQTVEPPKGSAQKLYFGNIGSDGNRKKEKHLILAGNDVMGKIWSGNPEMIGHIKKHITSFFQTENFGTRQNKGFGSFQVTHLNGAEVAFVKPSKYHFNTTAGTELNILWEHIDLLYRTLRSGINLKGGGQSDRLYFKSLLFKYAQTQGHQWDKRQIRLDLFKDHPRFKEVDRNRTDSDSTVQYNKGTPMLYRDMLGLSSTQSWFSYNATVTKKAKDSSIDRFKSPITFKPFQRNNRWEVYIIPHPIPKEMRNTAFVVESGNRTSTLISPDFNLEHYLEFAFGYFQNNDIEDYIGDHLAKNEVRIIKNIYQQLSTQV